MKAVRGLKGTKLLVKEAPPHGRIFRRSILHRTFITNKVETLNRIRVSFRQVTSGPNDVGNIVPIERKTSLHNNESSEERLHRAYRKRLEAIETMQKDPRQERLLSELAQLDDGLRADGKFEENGLYIYGGVGTGKTFCMDLFFEEASEYKGKKRLHFHEFMLSTHERLHEIKSQEEKDSRPIIKVAKEIARSSGALLCLDEFQVTDIGDAMILKPILETLFNEGTKLVLTSNRPPQDLYKNGLNRHLFVPCIKLLNDTMRLVDIGGDLDYRERRLDIMGDCKILFHQIGNSPLNINLWIDEIANEFCDVKPSFETVKVKVAMGRSLLVSGHSKQICRVTFSEICETEKSSHDYLALAQAFKVLVFTEVPCIKDMSSDSLRRFITFVDALYESRIFLAVSSVHSLKDIVDTSISFSRNRPHGSSNTEVKVVGTGGSSGRSTTMIGETEWSATGRKKVSLAALVGAEEADFAKARAASRLREMLSKGWVADISSR